jgi:hypothetical protein
MSRFLNELFAIQLDPPKGQNGGCVTYSLYDNGVFAVRLSAPYSEDEINKSADVFQATDPRDLQRFLIFSSAWRDRLKDCPDNISLPNFNGSPFNLVIDGHEIFGSYHLGDLEKAEQSGLFDKDALKAMKWDNQVAGMLQEFFLIIKGLNQSGIKPMPNAKEADYLKPVPRYLMSLVLNDPACGIETVYSVEDCLKAAARKAFKNAEMPQGKIYNNIFSLLKGNALAYLNQATTIEEFDKLHASLVNEIRQASLDSLSFAQAAYWLDQAYLYLLLNRTDIVSEKKMALLHAPIEPAKLKEEGGEDLTSYVFFQQEGRKEWAILHISPAYFYLESVYSNAHPPETSKVSDQA